MELPNKIDFINLSKHISFALRDSPRSYKLNLDAADWTSLAKLVDALNVKGLQIIENDIIKMVEQSEKKGIKY